MAMLAACAAPIAKAPLPALSSSELAAAQSQLATREAALRAQPIWSLQGRVALANGRQGGSGRIDWRQDGGHYQVALSAPVTRQSWQLSGDDGSVRLEGLAGGARSVDDPQQLLRETTGWEIPVAALS